MNILSKPTCTKEQLLKWVESKNPNKLAIDLLDLYWEISIENGVNPAIVYCQSMKETGYMKFGGVLNESFKNPCGLKITSGGGDYDADAHKKFDSWNDGILAQVQHLCLYAGQDNYPLINPVDPRHFKYLLGKCKTVRSLSGNWAGTGYGEAIERMCKEVEKIKVNNQSVQIEEIQKNEETEQTINNNDSNVIEPKKNKILEIIKKIIKKLFTNI